MIRRIAFVASALCCVGCWEVSASGEESFVDFMDNLLEDRVLPDALSIRHRPIAPPPATATPLAASSQQEGTSADIHDTTATAIPDVLVFTYRIDLLQSPLPHDVALTPVQRRLAANVRNTVEKHPGSVVRFLDDEACARHIMELDLPWNIRNALFGGFLKEKDGSMKGDVCRGAALYNTGGHYFDVDLLLVSDVRRFVPSPQETHFVSCVEARRKPEQNPATKGIFQAYVGAAPRSAIIRTYVELLAKHYADGHDGSTGAVGVRLMKNAIDRHGGRQVPGVYFFQEVNLNNLMSPDFAHPVGDATAVAALARRTRRIGGAGCDFIVYSPHTVELVAYSRVPGASRMCYNASIHFKSNDDKLTLKGKAFVQQRLHPR